MISSCGRAWANRLELRGSFAIFQKIRNRPGFFRRLSRRRWSNYCAQISKIKWSRSQKGFFESAINLGYRETRDMNYPDASGVGPFPCNNPNGIRISTAVGHLSQARHRLNLTVSPNSTVNKIILDKQKVSSLEVESGGVHTSHGENVVLAQVL
ncbi:MAG: hypothetical protein CM1200mP3_13000 [Chloroflexota bacterium]|nr:MAG: hypothetical protein CM1200mP3_13000 [Chloroflexota bacterium]